MNTRQKEYETDAIKLLRTSTEGILSTISVRHEGYLLAALLLLYPIQTGA